MIETPKTPDTPRSADKIGRREFTVASAMALLSGVAITVSACNSGSNDSTPSTPAAPTAPAPAPAPGPPPATTTGAVSANHGHTASVTAAQITAGGALVLDITGTSDHPHSVSLSAADLTQIGAGQTVVKTSTAGGGHTHAVTFN